MASPDSDAAPAETDGAPTRVDGRPPRLPGRSGGGDPTSGTGTARRGTGGARRATPVIDREPPAGTDDGGSDGIRRPGAVPTAADVGPSLPEGAADEGIDEGSPTDGGSEDGPADGPAEEDSAGGAPDEAREDEGPTGRPRPAPAADRDPVAAVASRAEPDDGEPAGDPELAAAATAAARADFTPPGRLDRIGAPPRPPFEPAEAPYHWTAALPSAVGRKVVVRIAEDVIDLGGTPVPIDSVTSATFKVQVEAALLRRAASARMSLSVTVDGGSRVRMAARNAASSRGAGEIVDVAAYLWALLGHATAGDAPDAVVDRIQRGGDVQIARVHLSRIGVSWKSEPIVRWSTIGPVEREDLEIVIRHDEGDLRVPLTATDAYLLPVLVPLLRRRFS